jgi:hypothetical protein
MIYLRRLALKRGCSHGFSKWSFERTRPPIGEALARDALQSLFGAILIVNAKRTRLE